MGWMDWIGRFAPIAGQAENYIEHKEYGSLLSLGLKHFGKEIGDVISNPQSIDSFVRSIKGGNQAILDHEQKLLQNGVLKRLVIRWAKLLKLDILQRKITGELDVKQIEKALEGSGYRLTKISEAEIVDVNYVVRED